MAKRTRPKTTLRLGEYVDFVVHAQRITGRQVSVSVYASPVGVTSAPAIVSFPASRADQIRASFRSSRRNKYLGRMFIKQAYAARLGRELCRVLLPPPVFALLAQSLAETARRHCGLRIRLALDADLIDLPWEYVYRPDGLRTGGTSEFLLLDPAISLVREAASPRIAFKPIAGRTRLAFVGARYADGSDRWEVGKEFTRLEKALAPISAYLKPEQADAAAAQSFGSHLRNAAIFHYAGHGDFDDDGRAFLVSQMSLTNDPAPPATAYVRLPRHVAWAELLRRTFAVDVLACPDCGGRLRLVATIADPRVIGTILAHLGLPLEPPRPAPPRRPSGLPDDAS